MLKAGIVGLPNVGKSTLFNAVTRTRKAQAENYPFCTIEPNIGVVSVPDDRIAPLAALTGSRKAIPTAIEFVDIAGLVKGASEGAGLGNQFLANIREVDAIVQVVRCFENDDIIHELGSVDPIRDIEIINTELILADLASTQKRHASREKRAKGGDKEAARELAVIEKLLPHLEDGRPALTLELSAEETFVGFHVEAVGEIVDPWERPVAVEIGGIEDGVTVDENERYFTLGASLTLGRGNRYSTRGGDYQECAL